MTKYYARDCSRCGHEYVGDPEDSDHLFAICPPCDATAASQDETFVCDLCGTRQHVDALAEVHHDETNTFICDRCTSNLTERSDS